MSIYAAYKSSVYRILGAAMLIFSKSNIEIPREKEEIKMCVAWDSFERKYTEIGRSEGRREGVMSTLTGLVREGILSVQDAANRASMPLEEFKELLRQE